MNAWLSNKKYNPKGTVPPEGKYLKWLRSPKGAYISQEDGGQCLQGGPWPTVSFIASSSVHCVESLIWTVVAS